jgi:DNA polymerase
MDDPVDFGRVCRRLGSQLQCEEFLGGRWLPRREASAALDAAVETAARAAQSDLVEGLEMAKIAQAPPKATRGHAADVIAEKQRRLADLGERLRTCHNCPLAATRKNLVPGEGHPDARLMFVGEAPGETEDEQGRPFVGRAGQLLTNIIAAMGLKREDVFIGNVLKCRPPGNRDPLATEIEACLGFLHEQIAIIEPEVIVALGAHAARTLLNSTAAIGQLRGRVHQYFPDPLRQPIKLVATYHPAYLLRSYTDENRRRVWQDMQRVLQELGLPVPAKKQVDRQ